MRAGSDLLQVGTADTTRMYFEQYLARADFWHWNRVKTNVVHTAINGGQHLGWNSVRGQLRGRLLSDGHNRVLTRIGGDLATHMSAL